MCDATDLDLLLRTSSIRVCVSVCVCVLRVLLAEAVQLLEQPFGQPFFRHRGRVLLSVCAVSTSRLTSRLRLDPHYVLLPLPLSKIGVPACVFVHQ